MMLRHARLQIRYKGRIFRGSGRCASMCPGIPKACQVPPGCREAINQVESYEELEQLLSEKIR